MTDTNVFHSCSARNFCRSADRGFAQRRASAAGAGRRGRGCGLAQLPCRQADRRRPPAAGAPRASARTRDHDRHRSGRRALSARARPRRRRFGAHPLFVGDSAALRAPLEEPRSADPDPLPQGRLHRRLRGGADRAARQGRRRAVGLDHRAAQGGLVGGARALEQARSLGQALRLLLGRRHPRAGPARGRRAVPAGHHRRHAGGQEGAGRPDRRRARERAILEGAAARSEATRTCDQGPSSRSPTARSASGRRSRKCGPRPAASAAGCTRPPTS